MLKSDQSNADEMKAEEITAYLRPNPQFTMTADGTQIASEKRRLGSPLRDLSRAQLQLSA